MSVARARVGRLWAGQTGVAQSWAWLLAMPLALGLTATAAMAWLPATRGQWALNSGMQAALVWLTLVLGVWPLSLAALASSAAHWRVLKCRVAPMATVMAASQRLALTLWLTWGLPSLALGLVMACASAQASWSSALAAAALLGLGQTAWLLVLAVAVGWLPRTALAGPLLFGLGCALLGLGDGWRLMAAAHPAVHASLGCLPFALALLLAHRQRQLFRRPMAGGGQKLPRRTPLIGGWLPLTLQPSGRLGRWPIIDVRLLLLPLSAGLGTAAGFSWQAEVSALHGLGLLLLIESAGSNLSTASLDWRHAIAPGGPTRRHLGWRMLALNWGLQAATLLLAAGVVTAFTAVVMKPASAWRLYAQGLMQSALPVAASLGLAVAVAVWLHSPGVPPRLARFGPGLLACLCGLAAATYNLAVHGDWWVRLPAWWHCGPAHVGATLALAGLAGWAANRRWARVDLAALSRSRQAPC